MTRRGSGRSAAGLFAVALALALVVLAGAPTPGCAQDARADGVRCTCAHREACYHFLNAPVAAPDDPCPCAKCEAGPRHVPGEIPAGWNAACMASNRLACFLKRHARSWKITCSECLDEHTCCPEPQQDTCPECGPGTHDDPFAKDALRSDARASMEKQIALERRFFDEKRVVVAYSRRFYVVTDLPKIRLQPADGKPRWATGHEYAHLMVQRAERTYDELSRELGGRIKLLRPMGIYLPKSEKSGRELQDVYFRNARNHMIYSSYSGRSESAISDGFCLNGFCVPLERVKQSAAAARSAAGDDYALHATVRHLITHVLSTCWIVRNGENRTMPRWAFVGAGHWMEKRLPQHADVVTYCTGEDQKLAGRGGDWRDDLVKRARSGKLVPIEQMLGASSLGHLDYEAHQQLWGYFAVAMEDAEWREPWVDLLADLRAEKDVREAFRARLSLSPEAFHDAWVRRLIGDDDPHDVPDEVTPSVGDVNAMQEPAEIAAAFRALGDVSAPGEVAGVLDLIGLVRSDLVRETGLSVLLRVTTPAAQRAVWEVGCASKRPLTRAYAARAVRLLQLADARDAIRALLTDPHWLVRSEAALAAAALRDLDAQSAIRAMTQDSSSKARIGAMDALVAFGDDVNSTGLPLIAKNLVDGRWQVRLAAVQALGRIGDAESVAPLLARLEIETGRVEEALYEALRAIAGEDFGNDPERWRRWWELSEEGVRDRGGFARTGPRPPPEEPGRYAPEETPDYYGRSLFSRRLMFVIDTSRSTNRNFTPDPGTKERLLGRYGDGQTTITSIAALELAAALDGLDPRVRFNVISFASDVAVWKDGLVPASSGNKRGGAAFARSRSPNGETNFHGALLAALEVGERPWSSAELANSADTITFLTDGSPTVGDITDPETFVRWFSDLNRYSRTRLHVTAFGTLGVNESFLQRLAHGSQGSFAQLFETNPR